MRHLIINLFVGLIVLFTAVCIWYTNIRHSEFKAIKQSLTTIFVENHDKPYLTEEGELALETFRNCAGIKTYSVTHKDSLNQELLNDIISLLIETPMDVNDIQFIDDTCTLLFRVNFSKTIFIKIQMINKRDEMMLHHIDGLCDFYAHIKRSFLKFP